MIRDGRECALMVRPRLQELPQANEVTDSEENSIIGETENHAIAGQCKDEPNADGHNIHNLGGDPMIMTGYPIARKSTIRNSTSLGKARIMNFIMESAACGERILEFWCPVTCSTHSTNVKDEKLWRALSGEHAADRHSC